MHTILRVSTIYLIQYTDIVLATSATNLYSVRGFLILQIKILRYAPFSPSSKFGNLLISANFPKSKSSAIDRNENRTRHDGRRF